MCQDLKTISSNFGIHEQELVSLLCASKTNLQCHWLISTPRSFVRHQHKNTIQALAWSPNGDFVASASRDQTVRVFDIRAMKEFRVLKGHKKEVCCEYLLHSLCLYLLTNTLMSIYSNRLAPSPPYPRVRWLRRGDPPLGPLRRSTTTNLSLPANWPPRYSLGSTRLERMGAHLSSAWPPPRLRLKRPHDPILGARTAGR